MFSVPPWRALSISLMPYPAPRTQRTKCFGPTSVEYALMWPVSKFTPKASSAPVAGSFALSSRPEYFVLLQKIE